MGSSLSLVMRLIKTSQNQGEGLSSVVTHVHMWGQAPLPAFVLQGAIPVVVTEINTVTEFLHIIAELTSLYLSKNCLQAHNIISKSFPLPSNRQESLRALDIT